MKGVIAKPAFRQRGLTLLEMIIALGVLASVIMGVASLLDRSASDTRAAVAAQHLKAVGNAATSYVHDNYSAIMGVATATAPVMIRVSDLIATNYLQTGFSATNVYGQSACVLVLQPSASVLTAMVVTEAGRRSTTFPWAA